MPVPRSAIKRLLLPLTILAVGLALLRAVLAVWFTSEVVDLPPSTELAGERLSPRVVLIVIDGMRYDTALESDVMPYTRELAARGAHGVCWASQVTMTGLGVRTLGTGTSPALADLLLNIHLPEITFDNVFDAIRHRGGHVAWIGNVSWKELFGHAIDIDSGISRMLEIVSRANTVYPADAIIVPRAIGMLHRGGFDIAIVHLGGLDNASHIWTPFGERFREKARMIDGDIQKLVEAAGPEATVLVTSDHGTSDRGHHGSGEPIARRTPLILVGPGVAAGRTFEARQVDVAPTIATLLGLPLPAPSEGRVLVEALDLSPEAAQRVVDANARQHQRYADAFGQARHLAPPRISSADLTRLGSWLEETRASESLVPLAWALVLALLAASLILAAPTWLASVAWALVAAAALAGAAGDGRGWLACGLGIALALVATALTARQTTCPATRAILIAIASLAALEALIAVWKLHHRFVEMKAHDVYGALHLSEQGFAVVAAGLVSLALGLFLRRWREKELGLWGGLLVLVVLAACGDALAIPAAIGAGALVCTALGTRREIALSLGALALSVGALALVDLAAFDKVLLAAVSPALVAAMAVAFLKGARRSTVAVLIAFGLACAAMRALGNPQLPYRLTLLLGGLSALIAAASEREHRRLEALGWAAALLLATMSRPAQMPGVLAWTLFAALSARLVLRAPGRSALVAATVLCVAVRMGFFALFEGAFEFSRLEVWLAYEGNPGTELVFGASVVILKFALPWVLAIAFASCRLGKRAPWIVTGWAAAFLCLRVAHIVLGMTVARGTFYSPFLDSGQLALTLAMLASVPVILALEALALVRELVASPRGARASPGAAAGAAPG